MPELPEVEVTRIGLLERLPGRTVVTITCSQHRLRRVLPRRFLLTYIAGQQIQTIDRRAKYLLIRMRSGAVLVVHLGMTGKLGIMERQAPRHKHDHLILLLDDGMEVRLNDSRRFGLIEVWPEAEAVEQEERFSRAVGIEPFGEEFTPEHLSRLAQTRRIPLKSFLMNSKIIAGIGNIYANEILFAARVHPLQPVHRVTAAQWRRIVDAGQRILRQAIDAGGSTISDFLGTNGHPGYFQVQFRVYGRQGLACSVCGALIIRTVANGRATYYCPNCQQENLTVPADLLTVQEPHGL